MKTAASPAPATPDVPWAGHVPALQNLVCSREAAPEVPRAGSLGMEDPMNRAACEQAELSAEQSATCQGPGTATEGNYK